jgi:cobalamin biosynthesis Co2+ chelatase CbiK
MTDDVQIESMVTITGAEYVRLMAEVEQLREALKEIIRLDDDWVPAAQDDYTYGGYIACADIARAALGGDK